MMKISWPMMRWHSVGKKTIFLLTLIVSAFAFVGCNRETGRTLSASTTLTSTTLSTQLGSSSIRPTQVSAVVSAVSSGDRVITPSNLSGKCVSLLYAVAESQDEGLVIFGNERPDIATSTANLYDFDFADRLAVSGSVTVRPGFVGGTVSHMVILFGYLDVTFPVGSTEKTVRIAMGDVEGMERGDIMLKVGTTFQWYDTQSGTFTSTRPTIPATISAIANFVDPVRPNRHYYSMNISLTNILSLTGAALANATGISSVIDFYMSDFVVLTGLANTSSISDAALMSNFTIATVATGESDSGLSASANFTLF
jgi:hypothetical protein